MTELKSLVLSICELEIIKLVMSVPYNKQDGYIKCNGRKIKNDLYQLECFTKTQAFHENVTKQNLCDKICTLMEKDFRQCEIFTCDSIYGIKISSKGKVLHNKRKNNDVSTVSDSHNKEKNYIINIENMPPVFEDIGIVTKDGKIASGKFDKYKQICKFVEFIDDVVKKDPREEYHIVDFGCGKSYLTFVCYHYMKNIMGKKVSMVGLDLKEKVIEDCNKLCKKYGYDEIKFLCMDIKDYIPTVRPDIVIALHACDVATDYALYNAYRWQTDYIFSAPCCQHEMNSIVKSEHYGLLCDYGLLKERFSAVATDAIRGKLLEAFGYSVDILEFIDAEYSPKNLLIRAKRTTKINSLRRQNILSKVEDFACQFNSHLTLEKLLYNGFQKLCINDNEFTVITGKASMLLKDAMAVRQAVFDNEQGYIKGASRDELDETAWIVNVYCDDKAVATSRVVYTSEKDIRLCGKICVLLQYRKYGIGKIMLNSLQSTAESEGAVELRVISQKNALGFYEKNGYSVCGDEFSDEGIVMVPVKKIIGQ